MGHEIGLFLLYDETQKAKFLVYDKDSSQKFVVSISLRFFLTKRYLNFSIIISNISFKMIGSSSSKLRTAFFNHQIAPFDKVERAEKIHVFEREMFCFFRDLKILLTKRRMRGNHINYGLLMG